MCFQRSEQNIGIAKEAKTRTGKQKDRSKTVSSFSTKINKKRGKS